MSTERTAVVSAINSAANLTEAARQLGASRRTLQNRMREYGLPRGKSGRPKHELPKQTSTDSGNLVLLGAVGAGLFFAWRWFAKPSAEVVGERTTNYLRGVDVQLNNY